AADTLGTRRDGGAPARLDAAGDEEGPARPQAGGDRTPVAAERRDRPGDCLALTEPARPAVGVRWGDPSRLGESAPPLPGGSLRTGDSRRQELATVRP